MNIFEKKSDKIFHRIKNLVSAVSRLKSLTKSGSLRVFVLLSLVSIAFNSVNQLKLAKFGYIPNGIPLFNPELPAFFHLIVQIVVYAFTGSTIYEVFRVTIGKYAIIRPSNIYGGPIGEGLTMGDNSNIGPYNYIGCSGKITIGNNVMLAPRVSIYAENHVFDHPEILIRDQGVEKKEVIIEDDCWIAANSILLAGVTIGKGSVVAAGSVVTENVPPYSVVAGVPAKWIKSRK